MNPTVTQPPRTKNPSFHLVPDQELVIHKEMIPTATRENKFQLLEDNLRWSEQIKELVWAGKGNLVDTIPTFLFTVPMSQIQYSTVTSVKTRLLREILMPASMSNFLAYLYHMINSGEPRFDIICLSQSFPWGGQEMFLRYSWRNDMRTGHLRLSVWGDVSDVKCNLMLKVVCERQHP